MDSDATSDIVLAMESEDMWERTWGLEFVKIEGHEETGVTSKDEDYNHNYEANNFTLVLVVEKTKSTGYK